MKKKMYDFDHVGWVTKNCAKQPQKFDTNQHCVSNQTSNILLKINDIIYLLDLLLLD